MRIRGIGTRALGLAVATVVLATLAAVVSRSGAGADKIEFPAKYKDGVLYTIADRYDVKQYRELYASASDGAGGQGGQAAAERDGPHPGPVQGPGRCPGQPVSRTPAAASLKGDLIGLHGDGEAPPAGAPSTRTTSATGNGSTPPFGADGKLNDKANYKACFQCHKPHDQIQTS